MAATTTASKISERGGCLSGSIRADQPSLPSPMGSMCSTWVPKRMTEPALVADKASSYPAALSGGQQQQGAIARALAMRPRVLLFDEPTSALDPESIGGALATMEKLAQESMTMIVVTQELSFARKAASRVWLMEEGRVVQDDTVDRTLINL